jgi:hypothetical protein
LSARESNEELFFAVRATYPGKAFRQITTLQKLVNRRADHRSPVPIPFLVTLRVHLLKLGKALPNDLEKRGGFVIPRMVELA